MNPFYPSNEMTWAMQAWIWEPLIKIDSQGQMQRHLAKSWKFSKDHKSIDLQIQSPLLWSDGSPVTEKDFKLVLNFTSIQLLKPCNGKASLSLLKRFLLKIISYD